MSSQKRRPRRRKPGDLEALKRELWAAVTTAADLLDHDDPQTRLRAVHAVSQSAASYRAVLVDSDLEARLGAVEEALEKASASKHL